VKTNTPKKKTPPKAKSPVKKSTPAKKKIRLMIVDDHPLFRAGLRRIVELEEDFQVIAEVADGAEALEKARAVKPQVLLLDVNLPGMNGLQVTRELTASHSECAVIILTAFNDDEQMLHALRAGASSYFPKDVNPQILVDAIRQVASGKSVVNEQILSKPQVAAWLLNQFAEMQGTSDFDGEHKFQPLSGREMQILQCITSGQSNKEIAKQLGISRQTVKNHMTSILRKLAVNDRTQAAVYALRHGWIRLQDTRQQDTRQ
jgi:DNA-binding NarL/FixJ family response regulator